MKKKEKDIKNDNVKEVKKKKHIFRKILLGILIFVILVVGFFFIKNMLNDMKVKKISNDVSELSKERTDYVFVEINPSFVLTLKENKVNDIACLNDDCMSIYDDLDVLNKGIGESIETIYNLVKNKGFDTSNGVKIKTTVTLDLGDIDYITIEYINENTKNDLLSNLKNNENIKNVNNDDYYTRLWEELKKDSDYDKVYTCNMNNKVLGCYIILDTGINQDSDYNMNSESDFIRVMGLIFNSQADIFNTLKKFGIEVKDKQAYFNGMAYSYSPYITINDVPYKNLLYAEKMVKLPQAVCDEGYVTTSDNTKCVVNDGNYYIILSKLNLVNPILNDSNMLISDSDRAESILQNYEISNELKKREKEWDERVARCLPKIKAAGYYYKNVNFPCCDGTNEEGGCYSCSDKESSSNYCHMEHESNGVSSYIDGKEVLLDGDYEICTNLSNIFDEFQCN